MLNWELMAVAGGILFGLGQWLGVVGASKDLSSIFFPLSAIATGMSFLCLFKAISMLLNI